MDTKNKLKKKALNLTTNPGVYLMKDKNEEIIYVGKAKNLRNRVVSYFRNLSSHDEKVKKMVENVCDFNFFVTDSEFEALVLECSLIKEYKPKYNILLKDSKGYKYIKITKENYPKISVCSKKAQDQSIYIGPYVSSFSVKQAVEEVNKIFMLPVCNTNFDQKKKKRPCLNYYIKRCMGLCQKNISSKEYKNIIDEAIKYIKKGDIIYIKNLEKQMKKAAKEEDFENAIKFRDKINAIKKIHETQKVYLENELNADVIAFSRLEDKICFVILKLKLGKIYDKEEFIFKITTDIENTKEEFLAGYYYKKNYIPEYVILDFKIDNLNLYEEYLKNQAKRKVFVKIPERGAYKNLANLAYENSKETLNLSNKEKFKEDKTLKQLQNILQLKKIPEYIEAYDISNLGDQDLVGGMVVFKNKIPYKKNYRKFKIKTVKTRDDYACMREVIKRRIEEFEEKKDESFKILPDLILIDGGKNHVLAVEKIFKEKNFDVPFFGLVKDSNHKTRAIVSKEGTISIYSQKNIFLFLTKIQDEVHRFTISYQKSLHKKNTLKFDLTSIEGVGEKTALKFLKLYENMEKIKGLIPEELSKTLKINLKIAEKIINFFEK